MSLLTELSTKIPKTLKANCSKLYSLVKAELASSRVLNLSTYSF